MPITEEIYRIVEAERDKLKMLLELGPDGDVRDRPDVRIMKAYHAIMAAKELMNPEFSLEEIELARKMVK